MNDLEINTKVSVDFNTIKEYLEDNGFKIVTDKKFKKLWQLWADYGLEFWY